MQLKLMETDDEKNNEPSIIKKSHKELTSLIQERIKNFGMQQKSPTLSNCKQVSKQKTKVNTQRLSHTRSSRLNSRTNNPNETTENIGLDHINVNQSVNNENINVASQQIKEVEEEKKEKIILKLNLKKFNLNSDALNSNKRKNSFNGDEKLYENKLKMEMEIEKSNKYFKNELNTDDRSIEYNESSDEDIIAAAASAMMELSNSAY